MKIIYKALQKAQEFGAKVIGLHASEMGQYLYNRFNFKESHQEHFSILQAH